MRIVRTSSGRVQPDPTGKVSGRGTYLCAQEACWTQGLRKNRLDGALRAPIMGQDRDALRAFYEGQFKLVGEGDIQ